MNGPELLEHAAGLVNRRRREYGEPVDLFEQVAAALVADARHQGQPGAGRALPDRPEARPARPRSQAPRQPGRRRRLRRGPAGGQPMIGPAGYRSCLARAQARTAPSDEDLLAMRRAAWRTQGVVVLRPEDVRDDWTRQALINEANRLYGRRPGGER